MAANIMHYLPHVYSLRIPSSVFFFSARIIYLSEVVVAYEMALTQLIECIFLLFAVLLYLFAVFFTLTNFYAWATGLFIGPRYNQTDGWWPFLNHIVSMFYHHYRPSVTHLSMHLIILNTSRLHLIPYEASFSYFLSSIISRLNNHLTNRILVPFLEFQHLSQLISCCFQFF